MSAPLPFQRPTRARGTLVAVCLALLGGVAAAEGTVAHGAADSRPFQDLADRHCVLNCTAEARAAETSPSTEAGPAWLLPAAEAATTTSRPGAAPTARSEPGLSPKGSLAIVGLGLVLTVVGAWRALGSRAPSRGRRF